MALYGLTFVIIHLPFTQHFLGSQIADLLSEKIGTDVKIERVELGFPNRVILDDVLILDQQQEEMLRVGRLTAKIEFMPLTYGRISISSAQVFGTHANLYKTDSLATPNFQFVLDSLASKDNDEPSNINLRINSLIIRHSSIAYNQRDVPLTPQVFNPRHLKVSDISAHIILKEFQSDSLNANIKRLTFKEQSGLKINRLSLAVEANDHQAELKDFRLQMPHSAVTIDAIHATYDKEHIAETIQYETVVNASALTPADITCLLPALKEFPQTFSIHTSLKGIGSNFECSNLTVTTSDKSFELQGKGFMRNNTWAFSTPGLHISQAFISQCKQAFDGLPDELTRLGDIHLDGNVSKDDAGTIRTNADIRSDVGNIVLAFSMNKDEQFDGHLDTESVLLGKILDNDELGTLATNISIRGCKDSFTAEGNIPLIEYKSYPYHNININGTYHHGDIAGSLKVDDPNVLADLTGELRKGNRYAVRLEGFIKDLRPQSLNLSDEWGNTRFSACINADFIANNLNDAEGSLTLSDFEMQADDSIGSYYFMKNLEVMTGYDDHLHFVNVKGDMGEADIKGDFDWNTLPQSFINYIASKMPTLPNLPKATQPTNNNFTVELTMTDTDWMQKLLNVPLSIERPLTLTASVDDKHKLLDVEGQLPMFTYNGNRYMNSTISISTKADTMNYQANLTKVMAEEEYMDIDLNGSAADNHIFASLHWNKANLLEPVNSTSGTINTITELYANEQGKAEAHIRVLPSVMTVREKPWNLEPCDIFYSAKHLVVDHFTINHERQHLIIDGVASESPADAITIDLKELDVAYILDLVDFDAVSFDGLATGTATLSQVFDDIEGSTDLTVDQFRFQSGRMGTLVANAKWNKADSQIDIDAIADNGAKSKTFINGYISPVREDINLNIQAAGTSIEFCQSFTSSFLHDVSGNAYGNVVLYGPLSELNLTGDMIVDGQATVTALNTTYTMQKDTIRLVPNSILVNECVIADKEGHQGTLNGSINHDHFSDFTFDMDITAENLLAYDFDDFNGGIVCGTVYATGTADLHGRPGEVVINCTVTPEAKSVFAYNATNPDAISQQEFITWVDHSGIRSRHSEDTDEDLASSTNIYINFNINATPQGTLRILMDSKTNDYVTLHGSGGIRASFYNKGPFQMFGTYTVEDGTYGITIQNIIKKNFTFLKGGTIIFGGDPLHANLNLQAQYTVNGVSLSDLNLGTSFASNTVRVNCLMNIQGTPEAPHVDFDFELPNVNAEENQMIRSVIASEQEMNQQVLYLLGIGRFYTQGTNNSQTQEYGQTQLAMQSFLSGTVSAQINEVLSQVIKSRDWNFGANISTGDEGWHNAEYEGIVSGRMLNNRLLINGQFGYRDNATQTTTSFIGDFDIQYLLNPNGNLALKVYNQTNDRYFTRSSLNTQGVGLIMKKDFNGIGELFNWRKMKRE